MGNKQLNYHETMKFWLNISIDVRLAKKRKDLFAPFVRILLKFFHLNLSKLLDARPVVSFTIESASPADNADAEKKIEYL